MLYPLADGAATTGGLWPYLVVFALVAIGWAGIPAIGGAVIAAAAVLASEGHLNFAGVLVASLLGTEAGGLAPEHNRPAEARRPHAAHKCHASSGPTMACIDSWRITRYG